MCRSAAQHLSTVPTFLPIKSLLLIIIFLYKTYFYSGSFDTFFPKITEIETIKLVTFSFFFFHFM